MKTLHFATVIHAPRETVWNVMLAPSTYTDWTAEFTEGSYFEGSWEESARMTKIWPAALARLKKLCESRG